MPHQSAGLATSNQVLVYDHLRIKTATNQSQFTSNGARVGKTPKEILSSCSSNTNTWTISDNAAIGEVTNVANVGIVEPPTQCPTFAPNEERPMRPQSTSQRDRPVQLPSETTDHTFTTENPNPDKVSESPVKSIVLAVTGISIMGRGLLRAESQLEVIVTVILSSFFLIAALKERP